MEKDFLRFVRECTCASKSVQYIKKKFTDNGFTGIDCRTMPISFNEGAYVVDVFGNALIAFRIGSESRNLKICASHIDSPALCVKPVPVVSDKGFSKLNVEVYGGPILSTWFDRTLSMSGKVSYNEEGSVMTTVVDFKRPLITIPNLAIHMNRDVNEGVKLNRQVDMLPVISTLEKYDFEEMLCKEAGIDREKLLDYEMYIYNCEDGCLLGGAEDMISAPRLDNLTSAYASMMALIENRANSNIQMAVFFDNEEIGSRTKQGADSFVLSYVIRNICKRLDIPFENTVLSGFLLSADVGHATHPNHPEKNDITNKVAMGKGTVIKRACSQGYATDSSAIAFIKQICKENEISFQEYVNRSDIRGGSTLGSMLSSILPMQAVDIGVAILAMHSARELMGREDLNNLLRLISSFYRKE